jgi:hypothetical protein
MNSERGSSVIGCGPKHVLWPERCRPTTDHRRETNSAIGRERGITGIEQASIWSLHAGRLTEASNFATPELPDTIERWHGLSDVKRHGRAMNGARGKGISSF